MKVLPSIALALAVAALGFALPYALSSFGEDRDPESETDWPGASIDFSDAIGRASVIAVARTQSRWRGERTLIDGARYNKLDITVKWYMKGEIRQPSPAWMMSRRADGTPTTLPAAGLDRILFFASGPGDAPLVFKIAQVQPQRMTELRDRLGAWSHRRTSTTSALSAPPPPLPPRADAQTRITQPPQAQTLPATQPAIGP